MPDPMAGPVFLPGNASLNLRMDPGGAVTCHTPLIMPPSGSITAQFYGETAPMPYDTSDGTIYMFPASVNGEPTYGLCVDHGMGGPVGPYGNISIDQALGEQTPSVKRAVAFVLANMPLLPTDDSTEFWTMLGLEDCYPGGLDGWDAWAIARYVVYHLLGQLPGGIGNLEYNTPKNECLREGGAALLSMALAYAGGTLDCGGGTPGGAGGAGSGAGAAGSTCGCSCGGNYTCGGGSCAPDNCPCCDPCGLRLGCQLGKIYCCNTTTPVTDQSSTYLVFAGCPNDIRECCGRVVLGPFRLQSSNTGTPDISLVPCNGCQGADIQLTDFCCNILAQPPAVGEEFYIAFRPPCTRYCFNLCASMMTTARAVYFFRSQRLNIQRIAIPLGRDELATTCIQICIDITPETPPPGPEPWWEHVLVNNNNNNNNNDSSNNDNNDNNSSNNLLSNLLNNLLSSLLSSNMMNGALSNGLLGGGMGAGFGAGLGGGFGPGPPFPPGPGPFPPGSFPPGPFPPGPPNGNGFPFPWEAFPPGTTPCPPPACGGPNPCCCPSPCPPCCCPCPPPCPPPSWCPPPVPMCPPPCLPWPCPCPEPCFLPYPYIPEPNLIIQPASLTYQALPMPVPCFCPPAWPQSNVWPQTMPVLDFPLPFQQPFQPMQQEYPQTMPFQQPFSQYAPPQPAQQVYSPVTVVVPPAEPMPLLLPEFSSAPRPDLSPFGFEDFDQFYRDWYGQ